VDERFSCCLSGSAGPAWRDTLDDRDRIAVTLPDTFPRPTVRVIIDALQHQLAAIVRVRLVRTGARPPGAPRRRADRAALRVCDRLVGVWSGELRLTRKQLALNLLNHERCSLRAQPSNYWTPLSPVRFHQPAAE
jgi:hypothetical protein